MSSSETSARPPQVTMAGWFVVVAAVMLLIQCFSGLAGLNSVETRDRVAEWLRTPAGSDLGWTQAQALEGLKYVLMVTGAAAAAAGILGWFALQRHHGARWALAAVAVITLCGAVVLNDPLGAFVAGAAALLWGGPARDWYAGRPIRQPAALLGKPIQEPGRREQPGQQPSANRPSQPPVQGPFAGPTPTQPPASANFGETRLAEQWILPRTDQPPPQVTLAVRLTWIACATAAAGVIGVMAWLANDPAFFVDRIMKAPTTKMFPVERSQVLPQLWLGLVVALGWAGSAAALGFFVLRRQDWARILLLVSAIPAGLFSILLFPISIFHVAAASVTVAVLLGKPARAWFSARPPVR